MGELEQDSAHVNVTLVPLGAGLEDLRGKKFPCPLCGDGLMILASKRGKPYCVCNPCGIQLFFRGKPGISRLLQMVKGEILIPGKADGADYGIALFDRLRQLKAQKEELEERRGVIFRDSSVENAILIVDAEIEKVEGELARVARKTGNGKTK
jgi:predicted RNA-binding Zn-ribbon protein involved in translation (DUF1610 family)